MSAESITGPPIEDRRRFRELWKELVYARLLGGALAGSVNAAYIVCLLQFLPDYSLLRYLSSVGLCLFSAMPSAVAKRGKVVLPLVAAAALFGLTAAQFGATGDPSHLRACVAVLASVAAAIGLAEGLLERSLATLLCGMIGGSLSGYGVALCAFHYIGISGEWSELPANMLAHSVYNATLHLGISLSLALGRWTRDWPKRSAARAGDDAQLPGE